MKDLAKIRSDVVGSLLRPAELKQARQRFDDGQLSREELRQVEDREIRQIQIVDEVAVCIGCLKLHGVGPALRTSQKKKEDGIRQEHSILSTGMVPSTGQIEKVPSHQGCYSSHRSG